MIERFVNLTPHEVVITPNEGGEYRFPSEGSIRIQDTAVEAPRVAGEVPCVEIWGGILDGLPAPEEGVGYIISRVAATAAAQYEDRGDLFFPFGEIRDDSGRIIGARWLARFA